MMQLLKNLWKDEEAPTAVEYAVMVAGVAIIVIVAAKYLGDQVSTTFKNVGDQVPGT
jgi:pilus assembly protein Flp/PilA